MSDPISIGGQTQYDITGGTRPGGASGTNLFHSFGDFNVPTNSIANFLNSGSVDLDGHPLAAGLSTSNILGRVTGGNLSNIFGTIQTTNFPGANLFLMNPAGFLFGPNATVNVGGMMTFTTADYLRLSNGINNGYFYSDPSDPSLLTTAPVVAFGFLGPTAASIIVEGSTLRVAEGQNLSLIGGNRPFEMTTETATGDFVPSGVTSPSGVVITGGILLAPSGSIHLASVASPGEILAGTLEHVPNTNSQSFGNLGAIQISEESVLDVSGDGGGTVLIRGGRFVLEESVIVANVTGPASGTPGTGIDIVANEDAVIVAGVLESFTETSDRGGAISLEANGNIEIEEAFIETATEGDSGHAGNIELRSTNGSIVMTDTFIGSASFEGTGNSGNIELTSLHGNITMTDSSFVSSQTVLSDGNAGAIRANAPEGDVLLANNTQFFNAVRGDGTLGELRITANNLTVQDSGISGDNIGPHLPGNITVDLSGTLELLGGPNVDSFIRTTSRGTAASGDLNIRAAEVFISDRGLLSTETFRAGAGGLLNILADAVHLTSGGQVRSGSTVFPSTVQAILPSGPGGTITISGRAGPVDSVLIDGAGSGIFTSTEGTGAGGMTNLSARSLTIQNGGTISASTSGTAPSATGGSITVNATDQVIMTGGASITASSAGPGNAGNITISGDSLTVASGGRIEASTSSEGAGGSIDVTTTGDVTIDAGTVTVQNGATLSATTRGSGRGGTVNVNASGSVALTGAGSGLFTNTDASGAGGNVNVTASQMTLDNGAAVSARSLSTGIAGNIQIDAGARFTMTNSSVTTEADQSSGGSITIRTDPSGTVQLTNSTISASVLDGAGGGGSVDIDPLYVLLQNSQILAQAVRGPGGNITITITNGGLFLPDANSTISASSQFGVNGTVTIQSPNAPASGQIQPLGKTPLQVTSLLNQHCAALAGGEFSSFTVAGRDSLPTEPGSWLAGSPALGSTGFSAGAVAEGGTQTHVIDPAHESTVLSLRQIAPAGFLTQAFAVEGSTTCHS